MREVTRFRLRQPLTKKCIKIALGIHPMTELRKKISDMPLLDRCERSYLPFDFLDAHAVTIDAGTEKSRLCGPADKRFHLVKLCKILLSSMVAENVMNDQIYWQLASASDSR